MQKVKTLFCMLLLPVFSLAFSVHRGNDFLLTSSIEWSNTMHDFGRIKQNIPVTATFEFKNPSMVPLVILSVEPQCGCTVASYPREPLTYGKKGVVSISFDAKNNGYFQKSILVTSNTEQELTTLIIKGEVISPEN